MVHVLTVDLVDKIRDDEHFDGIEPLVAQLARRRGRVTGNTRDERFFVAWIESALGS